MNARLGTNRVYRYARKLGVFLICLLAALSASGHAILKECLPAPHSIVSGPDVTIRLRFNSRIDAVHSRLYLNGGPHSQQIEVAEQSAPDTLVGQAKAVTAGEYRIQWQVLAVDGHITRGEVPFTVR
ncbi:MAG TPA: copper resistance protein CopC [Bryobacteraceae bacterium]|nr:copper resistance protein CopC [Bryobacteraceae bacterium]